jgi:hypothetical protein
MTIEVRQLVLRARVRDDPDEDDGDDEADDSKKQTSCGGGGEQDPCEDKEVLKEEILADCRIWLLEQLRALKER